MFFLAIWSFFQLGFFPGFIVLGLLRAKIHRPENWIYAFAISLIINYITVIVLTSFSFYTRPVVLTLSLIEVGLLVFLYRKSLLSFLAAPSRSFSANFRAKFHENFRSDERSVLYLFCLFLGFSAVIGTLFIFVKSLGTIFTSWDAIVSWNRWAVDWYSNHFPASTYHYPQLLPTSWSLTYQIMGEPLQFSGKAIMPVFFVALILSVFLDGFRSRSSANLFASSLIFLIFIQGFGMLVADGYADVAVAFFSFVALQSVFSGIRMLETEGNFESGKVVLYIGAFLAGSAGVVKQAGLFVMVLFPILFIYYVIFSEVKKKSFLISHVLLVWLISALLISASHYYFIERQIAAGQNTSEVTYVTQQIYHGKTPSQRMLEAAIRLTLVFGGREIIILSLFFFAAGLVVSKKRLVHFVFTIPFTVIWAAYFSYDLRNLACALPFIGTGIASGAQGIGRAFKYLSGKFPLPAKSKNWHLLVLLAFALALYGTRFSRKSFEKGQIELERQLENPVLNAKLYFYKETNGITGKILSNYQILNYLPEFKGLLEPQFFETRDPDGLRVYLEEIKKPEVRYILLPLNAIDPIQEDVRKKLNSGEFVFIFQHESYLFVKINK